MEIKKTVITAAGQNQRTLPLQTLVDGDGQTKSALAIIVEESLQAGIEEICVVVSPGDQDAYRAAAGPHGRLLQFVEQTRPLGYGHAVWCAREFTGSSPFLLLVGDHLYLSRSAKRCAQQLVETAAAEACAVSAVQATHESKLPYYGTVGGRLAGARKGLYVVSDVVEKPTPTEAEQRLIVPGLRAGYYLCFFGMHVLTPRVMALLGRGSGRRRRKRAGAFEHGAVAARGARAVSGVRTGRPPFRHWREIRPVDRATRAGAQRQGPRRGSVRPGRIAGAGRQVIIHRL